MLPLNNYGLRDITSLKEESSCELNDDKCTEQTPSTNSKIGHMLVKNQDILKETNVGKFPQKKCQGNA